MIEMNENFSSLKVLVSILSNDDSKGRKKVCAENLFEATCQSGEYSITPNRIRFIFINM